MKRVIFSALLWLSIVISTFVLPGTSLAQARTVISGHPTQKTSEGGSTRTVEAVPRAQAVNLNCVISEIGGKYYWATRGNKELLRHVSGAFITYVAVDGSGYVRIIDSKSKTIASSISSTEARFDYVEHLLVGLRSITYYGNAE